MSAQRANGNQATHTHAQEKLVYSNLRPGKQASIDCAGWRASCCTQPPSVRCSPVRTRRATHVLTVGRRVLAHDHRLAHLRARAPLSTCASTQPRAHARGHVAWARACLALRAVRLLLLLLLGLRHAGRRSLRLLGVAFTLLSGPCSVARRHRAFPCAQAARFGRAGAAAPVRSERSRHEPGWNPQSSFIPVAGCSAGVAKHR